MAFVVAAKTGRFEVRESRNTPDGPRSRTLASFKQLTDETIEKARARSAKPLSAGELREAALRAGAPVAGVAADEAARELIGRISSGEKLDPMLRRLLIDSLTGDDHGNRLTADSPATISDAARAAAEWIDAGPRQRGDALRDLLHLADALPVRLRSTEIGFPRLRSA